MKIATTDRFRITTGVLRYAATGFRLHEACGIRKCRRDGGCTGPLLRYDAAAARYVVARPTDAVDAIAPRCCLALDDAGRDHLAALSERLLARLDAEPWAKLPEETRAIAARDWSARRNGIFG